MSGSSQSHSRRKIRPVELKSKLAEHSTLYSKNELMELRTNCSKAREAIALYYVSLYYQVWQTDVLVRKLAQMAYANNYQGRWNRVQEILELEINRPEELEEYYIQTGHANDFYGNVLPLAVKILYRIKYIDTSKGPRSRVRYPQRVRGYKDKGSCRLPHEYHGEDLPGKERKRDDRRQYVHHPLVGGEQNRQTSSDNMPASLISHGGKEKTYDFNDQDKKDSQDRSTGARI